MLGSVTETLLEPAGTTALQIPAKPGNDMQRCLRAYLDTWTM